MLAAGQVETYYTRSALLSPGVLSCSGQALCTCSPM
jgi:hypothetical protein